jgi:uncharacterized membrane protein
VSKEPPKRRDPLTEAESAEILFASDSTCCKCRIPHRPLQIHHIDDDRSNNDPSNLAVLCLECHHETQVQGGFGRTLTPRLVRMYRDRWLCTVQEVRSRQAEPAGVLYAASMAGVVPIVFAVNPPARDVIIAIAVLAALVIVAYMVYRHFESRRA